MVFLINTNLLSSVNNLKASINYAYKLKYLEIFEGYENRMRESIFLLMVKLKVNYNFSEISSFIKK
jgi:hypothetical protein